VTTHTMSVPQFVRELSRRGVQLTPTPDAGLRVKALPGALSDDDRRILRALKADIVRHLTRTDVPAADAIDGTDALTCTAAGCTAVVDAYDEGGRPWCTRHRPDPGPIEPAPEPRLQPGEPPPWRCACGSYVSGLLPRCATCLRQPDGRPSPCTVCGAPVVRRPPPPRNATLRPPRGEEPVSTGPGLEVFCPTHGRGGHVLHMAAARAWPTFTMSDGTVIAAGKEAWMAAVVTHADERWYLRALIHLGTVLPSDRATPAVIGGREGS
jgi:hypothetical protein